MKKILIIILSGLLFLPTACDKELDINTNPLAASKADPNAVLPFVIVQYSNRKVSEIGTRCADVYQHVSATFNSPANGITTSTLTGNMWSMYYTQMLSNLTLVEKDARAAGATSNNVTAIAVTLKALAYFELTSIYEDVPFTEAINSTQFASPSFDTQQTVLKGIVTMLDDAVALIDAIPATGVFNVTSGDLIYGGKMDSWRRFARSLQLRTLMLLRNKDAAFADPKIVTLTTEDKFINTNSSVAQLKYSGQPGARNAWLNLVISFGTGSNETDLDWAPSPLMMSLIYQIPNLVGGGVVNDPRLALWVIPGTGSTGTYGTRPIGQFPTGAESLYRDNLVRANFPDIWFTPAEISFYKAELALKGVIAGGANGADAFYRTGLNQVLSYWGIDIPGAQLTLTTTQITTFIGTKPNLSTLTLTDALTEIGNQQYLEAFWRPVEAWNTVRRNKVPDVGPYTGSTISTMLKRFNYPPAEIASNPKTPSNAATDKKMWFEN